MHVLSLPRPQIASLPCSSWSIWGSITRLSSLPNSTTGGGLSQESFGNIPATQEQGLRLSPLSPNQMSLSLLFRCPHTPVSFHLDLPGICECAYTCMHTHTHTCTHTCTHTHTKPVLSLGHVLNTGALEIIHNLNTHSCFPSTFCVCPTAEKLFYVYRLLSCS